MMTEARLSIAMEFSYFCVYPHLGPAKLWCTGLIWFDFSGRRAAIERPVLAPIDKKFHVGPLVSVTSIISAQSVFCISRRACEECFQLDSHLRTTGPGLLRLCFPQQHHHTQQLSNIINDAKRLLLRWRLHHSNNILSHPSPSCPSIPVIQTSSSTHHRPRPPLGNHQSRQNS